VKFLPNKASYVALLLAWASCGWSQSFTFGFSHVPGLQLPRGITVESATNIYVAGGGESHAVFRVSLVATGWVVAQLPYFFEFPTAVALDGNGGLYVADNYPGLGYGVIRKMTPVGNSWAVTTLTSSAAPHNNLQFSFVSDVVADGAGNLYIVDSGVNVVFRASPAGTNWTATSLAGLSGSTGSSDGTNADARFNGPAKLVLDGGTNIYVTDSGNHLIRKVTQAGADWVTSTVAGLAGSQGSADGTNDSARFKNPFGIAVDSSTNIYVAEWGNNTIRLLKPTFTNWVVGTIAGSAGAYGFVDGIGTVARFSSPDGLALDRAGNLFVSDQYNNAIRIGQFLPILGIAAMTNVVTVSWPRLASNFVLETSGTLPPNASWTALSGSTVSGDHLAFTTNAQAPAGFFRLRSQ